MSDRDHSVGARLLAVPIAVLALVLAGCSTKTVAGHGSLDSAAPTASSTTGGTPTASTTPSASATASTGSGGRQALSCTGGKIEQPSNAPYCYLLPAGFKDVSGQTSTTVGASGEHPSSLAVTGDQVTPGIRDLIIVLDFTLKLNSDNLSDQVLTQQLDTLITGFEQQGFSFATKTPERVTVDNARGFVYHAKQNAEAYSSDLIFAFRGVQEIELNCQFKKRQQQIQSACQQILGSLQIKG